MRCNSNTRGTFVRALSAHGQVGDAHYQSVTGLFLRTNAACIYLKSFSSCALPGVACERWRALASIILSLGFATSMSGYAVPWGVDVAVSALSPQRVAAEQTPALPPLYLASPTSAQAGWRLTPPLNKLVPGHFQPLLGPPIRISLIGQCVQLPYNSGIAERHRAAGDPTPDTNVTTQ